MKFEKYNMNEYLEIVRKYAELENDVRLYVLDVMRKKNELTPDELEKPYYIDEKHTYIDSINESDVSVRVEEYWSYGGHETHCYHISLEELFSSNWVDDYKEKMNISLYTLKLEREKKYHEEELRERAELERLKKKYEN